MDFSELSRHASGHVEARIIQCAVRLGIFDALSARAQDSRTVATTLRVEPAATELLMNALAALELLEKNGELFSLTPVSATHLVQRSPQYLGGMILFDASLWHCWEQLPEAVRTGKPVRPPNMYQDDQAETETFIHAMDSLVKARGDADVLARSFDWHAVSTLLDVGSGPGTYPIELCRRFPLLKATIFEARSKSRSDMCMKPHWRNESGSSRETIAMIRFRELTTSYPCAISFTAKVTTKIKD